ncbi:hypothetical protein SRHO_G00109180 [Serrasalmus rhombeus]
MGKVIFYEDRNFQGRSYECSSDCSDVFTYLSRCNSCKVENGCFMVYDDSNFMGNQYFIKRGEYSDYTCMGMRDSIRSCRLIPQYRGAFRMRVYERENFGGQMHELMDDCDSLHKRLRMSDCQSCQIIFYEDRNFQGRSYETSSDCPELTSYLSRCSSCRVESGCFMVYERPNYMGHQMLVRRGEYPDNQLLMGMSKSDCIRSCRMIPMHRGTFRMRIFERENFSGQMHELMDDCDSIQKRYRMSDCQSCNVMEGHWLLYEQPDFRGRMIYLRPGEYRSLRDMGVGPMNFRIGSLRRIMEPC